MLDRAPASAETPSPLEVTYVARVCDSYSDIMANKARNDIQESLFNLGPDSTYPSGGIVDPSAEQAGSPACRPLSGWRFSTGRGITGKSPATENLSTVTSLFRSDIVTEASTPLLDAHGAPVLGPGGQPETIEGAATVQLSAAEAAWAQAGRTVWVEGGTPGQPLNGRTDLGFGALRCAQDALNGDNVDAVTFPQSRTHVFCYYYAVSPPPPPGTITVVKSVNGVQGDSFDFQGNISYNAGGAFSLSASPSSDGSVDFVRGATLGSTTEPPWSFTELAKPGWQAPGPATCVSQTGQSVISTPDATTTVDLAPGDHVTCTYTNTPAPLGAGQLAKESVGGVGSFPFSITGPTTTEDFTATTTEPGTPVVFATRTGAPSGPYSATETMPTDTAQTGPGTWRMTDAVCNGETIPFANTPDDDPVTATATYTAPPEADVSCLFTNTFSPSGSIEIGKTTEGGVGRFSYTVLDSTDLGRVADPVAVTTTPGTEVQAEPAATGLSAAPGSRYTVQETMPAPDPSGFWTLESATCGPNTVSVDAATASVAVELSPAAANASCHFVNRYQPYGTFSVVKTTTPDQTLRPAAAAIEVDCSDGSDGRFTIPPGQGANDSGIAVTAATLTCTATEPETGAAPGVEVATTAYIAVDDGAHQPYVLGQPFTAALGHDTQVVIENVLTAGSTPTPTPTPPVSPSPSPGGPGSPGAEPPSGLAGTGWTAPPGWVAGGAVLALLTGAIGAAVAARRRHSAARSPKRSTHSS